MPSSARVALITGCGKPVGIGNSTARALAAAGVTVVVADVLPTGVANEHNVAGDLDDSWGGVNSLVGKKAGKAKCRSVDGGQTHAAGTSPQHPYLRWRDVQRICRHGCGPPQKRHEVRYFFCKVDLAAGPISQKQLLLACRASRNSEINAARENRMKQPEIFCDLKRAVQPEQNAGRAHAHSFGESGNHRYQQFRR